jgi:magnesium chelatase subunit H
MKRKHTSVADCELRFVLITLDNHVTDSVQRAATKIRREAPGVHVAMHATASWGSDPSALERCLDDIAHGDIIVVTMLFMEDQIKALLPALQARREHCDAMICAMSAAEVMKLTRMGRFSMDGEAKGPVALLKRLRGKNGKAKSSAGAQQMTVLRQLPKILRFIPGTAQDVRVYFLTLQYWLASSDENLRRMICELIDHYAAGEREALRGQLSTGAPLEYPETGLYDPARKEPIFERVSDLPRPRKNEVGTVGVLIMRSYALAGNSAHYDRLIATLRERGLRVITAFASGLDARPAVEKYFIDKHGKPVIDAMPVPDRVFAGRRPGLQRHRGGRRNAPRAGRALHRRPRPRVPEHRTVGELDQRPDAGRGDDDGRHPGARWRHAADGVRRAQR